MAAAPHVEEQVKPLVQAARSDPLCVCVCMMVHGAAPKHVKAWRIFARDGACWGNVGGWGDV